MDSEYSDSYEMYWGTLGTVRPYSNFHPDRDVTEIVTALENKDTVTLLRILTNRNNPQRQVIAQVFQELTHKDIITALKKALSGDLVLLLVELLMTPVKYEAYRLQEAMAGLGTDEETLAEILSTRSGKQLQNISAGYKEMYKKDLEKEIESETSNDFEKLLKALLHKGCVAGVVQTDIETLSASLKGKKAEAGQWIDILTSRDVKHLDNGVLMGLELELGQTVDQIIEKRFSGDFRLGLKVLVQCIQNRDAYLATRLKTMKKEIVQRIMVSHSEEDLLCIRAAFIKLTGTSLYTALQNHFKGDYLKALLAICRSED
uniref:Annexin n=1 Tax=Neolamprologus brichardi TaxID=32507 RepID=A0A3Q4H3Q0_NEOBR